MLLPYFWYPQVEHGILVKAYHSLTKQMNLIFKKRLWYIMLEQFLMKYTWSGVGMIMTSIPLLTSTKNESELSSVCMVYFLCNFLTNNLSVFAWYCLTKCVINKCNLAGKESDGGVSERTQYFTTAKNMLMSGADAVERLLTSYKVSNKGMVV